MFANPRLPSLWCSPTLACWLSHTSSIGEMPLVQRQVNSWCILLLSHPSPVLLALDQVLDGFSLCNQIDRLLHQAMCFTTGARLV